MFLTKLNKEDLNRVNGGIISPITLIPISTGCKHLGPNGKCEDPFTTPPTVPPLERLFF
ncbi:hypothetical protein J3L16_14680 [Alteromonas sp. 5E99-2]|uniref:hypothetical protein n=1 Tax=Alteromonas sp. 5E99-2 TaxID=2817683 RepID=UPI001A994156|nr:hypothetical protein [Alteromonas sp. 5E99-2]MBO1256937.1 hypothetical protein [Alteromonas sp. 5E99-2]